MKQLYNEIGGGRAKYPTGWMLNATWPFSRLILNDNGIEYKLVHKRLKFAYNNIERVSISRLGYIWFTINGNDTSYAFTGKGLDRAVNILKEKNILIAQEELDKLGFAVGFVKAEIIITLTFFTIWLLGVLTGITLILAHLLQS